MKSGAEQNLPHDAIVRLKGAHPHRKELPVPELGWQDFRPFVLDNFHDSHDDNQQDDGTQHSQQHVPAGDGQSEHEGGKDEEHEEDVDDSEPSVIGRAVSEKFCHRNSRPEEWERVEDANADDVEEKMAEGHLQRVLEFVARVGKS